MKIPKWFGILLVLAFIVAIISHFLGTGKNFSTFLQYIDDLKLYNPLKQTMDYAETFVKGFTKIKFEWSTNPFKLTINLLNYQYKLLYNLFQVIILPLRFVYYIMLDLGYMLKAVYDFIA